MPEIILKQDLTQRQDNPEPRIRLANWFHYEDQNTWKLLILASLCGYLNRMRGSIPLQVREDFSSNKSLIKRSDSQVSSALLCSKWQRQRLYCQGDQGSFPTLRNTEEASHFLEATVYWKKAEKINHTFKKTMAQLCQETNLRWNKLLPIALLQMWVTPRSRIQLSP